MGTLKVISENMGVKNIMVKSRVKFSSVKFDKIDKEATLPAKFIRMLNLFR
ncbi:MAG: hypothetical protein L0956_05425 [Candidatus Mariimomonas ferrooxydans]